MKLSVIKRRINTLNPLVKGVLLGFLAIVFVFVFKTYDETNDDTAIQKCLSMEGAFTPFINRLLSLSLGVLFKVAPDISWWFVFSIFVICLSIVIIAYIVCKKTKGYWQLLGMSIVLFTVYFWGLYEINFTRTAMIASFSGALLIVDSTLYAKSSKVKNGIKIASGFLFYIIGVMIRKNAAIISWGMVIALGVALFIADFSNHKEQKYKKTKKVICYLCLLLTLLFVLPIAGNALLNDAEKEFLEYNSARSKLNDYRESVLPYKGNEEFYAQNGILSESDLILFENFVSEDWDVFKSEYIINIAQECEDNVDEFKLYFYIGRYSTVFFILMLTIMIFFVLNPKKMFWIIGSQVVGCVFVLCYLTYIGRIQERVYEGAFSIAALSILYASFVLFKDAKVFWRKIILKISVFKKILTNKKINGSCIISVCALSFVLLLSVFPLDARLEKNPQKEVTYRNNVYADIENASDLFFFPPGMEWGKISIQVPVSVYYRTAPQNVMSLGGWNARLPQIIQKVKEYGIENPMKAIFEDERVLSEYSEMVCGFIKRRYNENISVSHIRTYGKIEIVKYSLPIEKNTIKSEIERDFEFITMERAGERLIVECKVDSIDKFPYLYLNIEQRGTAQSTRSFRLERTENGCYGGELYTSSEINECNYYLVVKDEKGVAHRIVED